MGRWIIRMFGNSGFFTTYFIVWVMAFYVILRLISKAVNELDFKLWENDIAIVSILGFIILSFKLWSIFINKAKR